MRSSKERVRDGRINKELYILMRTRGKCEACGEYWSSDVLCFHHKNPEDKTIDLSADMWRQSKGPSTKVLTEAQDCAILCMNCHSLEHKALTKGESILNDKETYLRYRNKRFSCDPDLDDRDSGSSDTED